MSRLLNPIGVASAAMRTPARRRVVSVVLCSMLLSVASYRENRLYLPPGTRGAVCSSATYWYTAVGWLRLAAGCDASGSIDPIPIRCSIHLRDASLQYTDRMLPIAWDHSGEHREQQNQPPIVVYPEQSKSRVF